MEQSDDMPDERTIGDVFANSITRRRYLRQQQRFPSTLQTKPVPFYDGISDGRSSFGFSWSLVLSLLSFSLFLFSYLTTSVLACSIAETCRFFRETQHCEQEEGGVELETKEIRWKPNGFSCTFSFEVDPLRRIRVKSLVTWIDNVASNGGCDGN